MWWVKATSRLIGDMSSLTKIMIVLARSAIESQGVRYKSSKFVWNKMQPQKHSSFSCKPDLDIHWRGEVDVMRCSWRRGEERRGEARVDPFMISRKHALVMLDRPYIPLARARARCHTARYNICSAVDGHNWVMLLMCV